MHPPKNLKELRGLQGRLSYIRRFIANVSTIHPTHEKRCLFCIGSSLSRSLRGYQKISYKTFSLSSSHIRKTSSLIYVDDIIFGSTNELLCKEFEQCMQREFEMSLMGELNYFLGLQIKQMRDGIFICQAKYS